MTDFVTRGSGNGTSQAGPTRDAANEDGPTVDEFLDGWALWQEHRPQTAEDWVGVAKRCAADPTFDYTKSSPVFGAAYLLAKELIDRG